MKHYFSAQNQVCEIVPLEYNDIEYLRKWRNDPSLSKYLREIPYITKEMQEKWFEDYLIDPNTYFWVIVDKSANKVIGSLAIYSVENNTCEIGKVVIGDKTSHGKGLGYNSLLLAMCIGISKLGIQRFKLDVHTENIAALSIYIKAGFLVCGSHPFIKGGEEIEMEIDKNRFESCNKRISDVSISEECKNRRGVHR